MRDRPSDLGLAPYGEQQVAPPPAQLHGLATLLLSPLAALREASGSRTFWILFATFFVCGLSTNGLIQTHWISLCGDFGVAPVGAAGVLAGIGVFDFIGTILSGWLSDRYDNRWLLFWYYGLRGLSLLYLPFTDFSFYGLSFFAVFYGLDWVATVPPTVRLAADRFGARAGQPHLRLDLRRPPAGRRHRRLWRRAYPRQFRQLSAGALCRRHVLPPGLPARPVAQPATAETIGHGRGPAVAGVAVRPAPPYAPTRS